MPTEESIVRTLKKVGSEEGHVPVVLSTDLVRLLSDHLYKSAAKAIEELVVNSYDANANVCRIHIPQYHNESEALIFDDGIGMTEEGLRDLWHIGRSKKRSREVQARIKRKQIGKFGIGKLAVYAIANNLTYVSRVGDRILSTTIDFRIFEERKEEVNHTIHLPLVTISDFGLLNSETSFLEICSRIGLSHSVLLRKNRKKPWTIAIIRDFRKKSEDIKIGILRRVLSTAMPIESKFKVFINKAEVKSSKLRIPKIVDFDISSLPDERLRSLESRTNEEWTAIDSSVVSSVHFKDGIRGSVSVVEKNLEGKSSDIGRSYGFFIYVRNRLINETDPLFGTSSSRLSINRMYARIYVDGLDESILISRDEVDRDSSAVIAFREFLREVVNEARAKYDENRTVRQKKESQQKESERDFVDPSLVESPLIDVLSQQRTRLEDSAGGKSPAGDMLHIAVPEEAVIESLLDDISLGKFRPYKYEYRSAGESEGIVKFDPQHGVFLVNKDHDFVLAHTGTPYSAIVLEDFVTAEVILEANMRVSGLDSETIRDIFRERDKLLRSLARNHPTSMKSIGKMLESSSDNERELEFSLVAAARAIGFEVSHLSGSGEPDGVAFLDYYPKGRFKITLEAKSSENVPGLGSIDFAGLAEHMTRHDADGCLLVAPSYPGKSRKRNSAASFRARDGKISCWTIAQLSRLIKLSEVRRFTATDVLDIVLNHYAPDDVEKALEDLFGDYDWSRRELNEAVAAAIRNLSGRLTNRHRTIEMIATEVTHFDRFKDVDIEDIRESLEEISVLSQGGLIMKDPVVELKISPAELERRVSPGLISSFRLGDRFRAWRKITPDD